MSGLFVNFNPYTITPLCPFLALKKKKMKILSKYLGKDILTQVKSILREKKSIVNSTFNGEIYQLSQRLRQE